MPHRSAPDTYPAESNQSLASRRSPSTGLQWRGDVVPLWLRGSQLASCLLLQNLLFPLHVLEGRLNIQASMSRWCGTSVTSWFTMGIMFVTSELAVSASCAGRKTEHSALLFLHFSGCKVENIKRWMHE